MRPPAEFRPLPTEDLENVVRTVGEDWLDLKGGRLFITGGTGFFGLWLLESLLAANETLGLGIRATVLSRKPEVFAQRAPFIARHPSIELLKGDVRNFSFPEGEFSHVIHAAAEASAALNRDNPLEMFSVIVEGTRRVMEFAGQKRIRRLLLVSSGAVYGRQPTDLYGIPEDHPGGPDPLKPHSAYGEGKRVSEHLGILYGARHQFAVVAARCFAFHGPHLPLDEHFAIGNFLRDGLAGRPIQVKSSGTSYRSYLYASDLATWLWVLLLRGKTGAYNVGHPEAISIADLARTVQKVLETGLTVLGEDEAESSAQRYVPCVDKASRELGLEPKISLQEGIVKTVRWLRET